MKHEYGSDEEQERPFAPDMGYNPSDGEEADSFRQMQVGDSESASTTNRERSTVGRLSLPSRAYTGHIESNLTRQYVSPSSPSAEGELSYAGTVSSIPSTLDTSIAGMEVAASPAGRPITML